MKRPLFWIGIVFLSATAVFLLCENAIYAAVMCAILLLSGFIFFGKAGAALVLAALMLAAGSFAVNLKIYEHRIEPFDDEVIGTMVIGGMENYGSRTVLSGNARMRANNTERVMPIELTVWGGSDTNIGDEFSFSADVYKKRKDTADKFDALSLTLIEEAENDIKAPAVSLVLIKARAKVCDILRDMTTTPCGGILCAMLAGEKAYISDSINASFRAAGLSHLLVVSGMHLCVVAEIVSRLFSKSDGKKRFALITAGVWAFSALTGFGISVVRAAIMVTIGESAPLFLRKRDTLSSLAAAGILIAILSPSAVGELSFLLSFGAVFGIALFSDSLEKLIHSRLKTDNRIANGIISSISVSIAAQTGILPISAIFFGTVPVLGVLANIPAIPLVTPIIILGALGVVLAPLRAVFGLLCDGFITVLCFIAKLFGALPLSKIGVGERYVLVFVIFFWCAAVLCAFSRPRKELIRRGALFSLAAVLFCSCVHLGASLSRITLTYFDDYEILVVSKGDKAVIFGAPENSYEADRIASHLERNNITRIDAVCTDSDVISPAVFALSERVETEGVMAPDTYANRSFCHSTALALYKFNEPVKLFGTVMLDASDSIIKVTADGEGKEIYPHEGLCVIIKKYSNVNTMEDDILWQIRTPVGGSHDI